MGQIIQGNFASENSSEHFLVHFDPPGGTPTPLQRYVTESLHVATPPAAADFRVAVNVRPFTTTDPFVGLIKGKMELRVYDIHLKSPRMKIQVVVDPLERLRLTDLEQIAAAVARELQELRRIYTKLGYSYPGKHYRWIPNPDSFSFAESRKLNVDRGYGAIIDLSKIENGVPRLPNAEATGTKIRTTFLEGAAPEPASIRNALTEAGSPDDVALTRIDVLAHEQGHNVALQHFPHTTNDFINELMSIHEGVADYLMWLTRGQSPELSRKITRMRGNRSFAEAIDSPDEGPYYRSSPISRLLMQLTVAVREKSGEAGVVSLQTNLRAALQEVGSRVEMLADEIRIHDFLDAVDSELAKNNRSASEALRALEAWKEVPARGPPIRLTQTEPPRTSQALPLPVTAREKLFDPGKSGGPYLRDPVRWISGAAFESLQNALWIAEDGTTHRLLLVPERLTPESYRLTIQRVEIPSNRRSKGQGLTLLVQTKPERIEFELRGAAEDSVLNEFSKSLRKLLESAETFVIR